jgi:iron complex outermembrane receptor protein
MSVGSACALVFAAGQPGFAQQSDQPTASAAGGGLEEIVVTARRREEKIQTVPISITAFSGADIQQNSIQNAEDLQHFVPSLYVSNTAGIRSAMTYTIRGEGNGGTIAYFADVPIQGPNGGQEHEGIYFDLESVQVLQGPQGTLFGRNTTGGAVLFEPKRPTNDFEGYFQETLGSYNWHEEEGALNIPIIDEKLLVRLGADIKMRDGYTKDVGTVDNGKDYDNEDYWSFRVGITFRPTDNFENYLLLNSFYSHTNGTGESWDYVNPKFATLLAYPNIGALFAAQVARGPRETAYSIGSCLPFNAGNSCQQLDKIIDTNVTDIATWNVTDDLTLKNIASYSEYKYLKRFDDDGGALPIIDDFNPSAYVNNQAVYTEELQLQGKALHEALNWQLGGFLLFTHPGGFTGNNVNELVGVTNTLEPLFGQQFTTERSQAIYAQGTYDLADISPALEGFKLTAGYRYTFDFLSSFAAQSGTTGQCVLGNVGAHVPLCGVAGSANFHAPTWTASLDYQVLPETLLYVTGSRGYREGGFNNITSSSAQFKFQPELVTDVEVGVKSEWELMGVKGRTNLDAYHSAYANIQRSVSDFSAGRAATFTENAATATIEGIEFGGTIVPTKGVELSADYAYTFAKYDKYISPAQGDLSNLPFPNVPLNKFSVTGRYYLPVDSSWGDISAALTWSWQSHVVQGLLIDPVDTVSAYSLMDMHVDWKNIFGRPFDASFFITNLTDTVYRVGELDLAGSLGLATAIYNEPRMIGVQLKYRFGPGLDPGF